MPSLSPGARLGPYEITGPLGAGGMGEVYRARDTRLNRDVAIKCLAPDLRSDPASHQRIEREARAAASLSHPNICTLLDVGHHDGELFLVMELVDGKTLSRQLSLAKGGLPLAEALAIATQLADALAVAHRQGLVHRDIKPGNVMLTRSGAKLLDFGLARPADIGGDDTRSLITQPHERVGTPAYMAPEQLTGIADQRSDIYALGAVLFEMLTGERASASDGDPSTLKAGVPAVLDRAVRKCLHKNPDQRWQSAADLADELRWIASTPQTAPAVKSRPSLIPITLVAVVVAAVAVIAMGWPWRTTTPAAATHLAFVLPEGVGFPPFASAIAVSPDGSTVALTAALGTGLGATRHLFVKRLDAADVRLIPGSDRALYPFFSPDGQSVAFFADRKLKRWSASSGSITVIADLADYIDGNSATWGSDGTILFGENADYALRGISRVPAAGGTIEVLTRPDTAKGEQTHFGAQQLENGVILFTIRRNGPGGPEYHLAARKTSGEIVTVVPGASMAASLADRRILYQIGDTLMRASFDPETLAVSAASQIVGGLAPTTGTAAWGVGKDVLVYRAVDPPRRRLVWVDRSGESVPIGLPVRDYATPRLSPTGDRASLSIVRSTTSDLWVADLRQQTLTQASQGMPIGGTVWSPDGSRLFSARVNGSARDIVVQPSDGSAGPQVVVNTGEQLFIADVSPDQRTLVLMKPTNGNRDIWLSNVDGTQLRPIVQQPATEYGGRVSPDGKWMSYFSEGPSTAPELFVTPFPNGGPRWQISRDGAREAVWSRDGSELFYRNGDRMLSVKIKPGAQFDWEPSRVLFSGAYHAQGGPGSVQYDVAADGRFLMIEEAPRGSPSVNVVLGWQRLAR